jgi:cytochrome c2
MKTTGLVLIAAAAWAASTGAGLAQDAAAGAHTYSDANKNSGITWDEATLKVYLKDPKAKVPGTKMTFPGLSSDTDIDNVIAYLKTFPAPAK